MSEFCVYGGGGGDPDEVFMLGDLGIWQKRKSGVISSMDITFSCFICEYEKALSTVNRTSPDGKGLLNKELIGVTALNNLLFG